MSALLYIIADRFWEYMPADAAAAVGLEVEFRSVRQALRAFFAIFSHENALAMLGSVPDALLLWICAINSRGRNDWQGCSSKVCHRGGAGGGCHEEALAELFIAEELRRNHGIRSGGTCEHV